MNSLVRSFLRRVSFVTCLALGACASSSRVEEEAELLRRQPPLPRSIAVLVIGRGEQAAPFGATEIWTAELESVFRELRVAEEIVAVTDAPDLVVAVALTVRDASPPVIQTQGALLNFLAWSTIPLLPWWIQDVDVDPGLGVEISRAFTGRNIEVIQEVQVKPDSISTALRDRTPLWSWTSLGALVVPPFAFASVDSEHFDAVAGPRVRRAVAVQVAKEIKSRAFGGELLQEISIRTASGETSLEYRPSAGLGKIVFWYERASGSRRDGPPADGSTHFHEDTASLSTSVLLPPPPASDWRIRLEALDRGATRAVTYTLRSPRGEAEAPRAEAD